MSLVDTGAYVVHLLFAGLWAGSLLYVTVGVLPTALTGEANAGPLSTQTERLRWVSRISSLALLLTGGHTAARRYTVETLAGTGDGHLVVTMVVLWFAMTGLVEVAGGRMQDGFEYGKVQEPAREARPFLYAASALGVVLLAIGGLLAYA